MSELVLIAAMDSSKGVGNCGRIPWYIPTDMKRFNSLTVGGAICYGKNTWRSLPNKVLADRYNILISTTTNPALFDPNGSVVSSVAEALAITRDQGLGPLFVLGGNRAWTEALQLASTGIPTLLMLTKVLAHFECDTFFPYVNEPFTEIFRSQPQRNGVDSVFSIYANF